MKKVELLIKNTGEGMAEALAETERLGKESGLSSKEVLRLRLLAEELFGMVRSIAGEVEARYSVEVNGKAFGIRLVSDVKMTQEVRKQLISVSSDGKNAAAKGFMGKIRDMISSALLPDENGASFMSGFSMGLMGAGAGVSPAVQQTSAETLMWSMNKYKTSVNGSRGANEGSAEAWDELEKSIVASIADEVTVRVKGTNVSINIDKAF